MSNAALQYVVNDMKAAKGFIAKLPRKLIRSRFAEAADWEPQYVVLALRNEKPVAMADCILSADGDGANASLLAAPSCGAYAISALAELKRLVPATGWYSTLRSPTPSTVLISRRYFDFTYDQIAWQMSNLLTEQYGLLPTFIPYPLIVSSRFLRKHRLPPLSRLDAASRWQLVRAGRDPLRANIKCPLGDPLGPQMLTAFLFEILGIQMRVRQEVSRIMLVSAAAASGVNVNTEHLKRLVRLRAMEEFVSALSGYQSDQEGMTQEHGLFSISG